MNRGGVRRPLRNIASAEDAILYLREILQFIERIESKTNKVDYETFANNIDLIDIVENNLGHIGEAVRVLSTSRSLRDKFYHYHIDWEALKEVRKEIDHGYFAIDYQSMWKMATKTLPDYKQQFQKILSELEEKRQQREHR